MTSPATAIALVPHDHINSKANSHGEYTKILSNDIDPITPDVGAWLADELYYRESGEALLGFGYKSSNGKSDLISLYWFILYGINNVFFD